MIKGIYICVAIVVMMSVSCVGEKGVYTKEEMESLPREELMADGGKVFYVISDNPIGTKIVSGEPIGGYIKKAQVFTEEQGNYSIYLTIDESIIRDSNRDILIDASNYGGIFYAWILIQKPSKKGFWIYLIRESKGKRSISDPISIAYDIKKNELYMWRPDPSEY